MTSKKMMACFAATAIAGTIVQLKPPDRYPDFAIRYVPFTPGTYRPVQWSELQASGADVTSVLFKRRYDLRSILKRAKQPAHLSKHYPVIFMDLDGERWLVDGEGVVRNRGKDLRLNDKDYESLRWFIVANLPQNTFSSFHPPFKRSELTTKEDALPARERE